MIFAPVPLIFQNIVNAFNTEEDYHNKTSCTEEEMPTNERTINRHSYTCSIPPVSTYCNVVIFEENQ